MKKLTALVMLALALTSALLAGCNTVRGAGEDMQDAGRAIQRAADK